MESINTKITVITVVRNREQTLENTILSVLNQTYGNIEYIVIDGASTDNTVQIIKQYDEQVRRGKYPNVEFKWISEPDNGMYDAMNKGISMTTGEWLNFMNSDDTFSSNNIIDLLAQQGYFKKKGCIVYGNRFTKDVEKNLLVEQKASKEFWRGCSVFHQACFICSTLHKANLYDKKYMTAGDYDFFYKMQNQGVKFIYAPFNICIFSQGGVSSSPAHTEEVVVALKKNNTKNVFWGMFVFYYGNKHYFLKKHFPCIYSLAKRYFVLKK